MIKIIQADITQLKVDAIVNAANESLLGGGGVDGAIHRAAGPALLAECKKLKGCRTGQAKITPAYHLPAKYVIHTVGPVWQGGGHNEAGLLASCYRESIALAAANNIKTLAFSAISCGIYGFPIRQAAEIALGTLVDTLRSTPGVQKVFLVCFNESVLTAYEQAYKQIIHNNDD